MDTATEEDPRESFEYGVYKKRSANYRRGLTTIHYRSTLRSRLGRRTMDRDLAVIFEQQEPESDCISNSEVSLWSDLSRERIISDDHICDSYNVLWVEQ
jgi:hypothetical protein